MVFCYFFETLYIIYMLFIVTKQRSLIFNLYKKNKRNFLLYRTRSLSNPGYAQLSICKPSFYYYFTDETQRKPIKTAVFCCVHWLNINESSRVDKWKWRVWYEQCKQRTEIERRTVVGTIGFQFIVSLWRRLQCVSCSDEGNRQQSNIPVLSLPFL